MVDKSTQMNTKIRLVRCPRCRKVLPELPEIPVYQCGGCGTILQAKNRKKKNNETQLSSDMTNSMENYDRDSASESSNQGTTLSLESSPASDHKGGQFETENHKQPGSEFSDELPCSTELSCHGNETESPDATESIEEGKHECQLGENANIHGDETLNCNIHQPGSNFSDELHGNETLSPEARESSEQGEANCQLGQDATKSGDESQNYNCQQPSSNISDELPSSTGVSFQVIESSSPEACESMELSEHKLQSNKDGREYGNEVLNCNSQQPGTKVSGELPSATEISPHGNGRSFQEARESMEQGKHQYALQQEASKNGNEAPNHNTPQPGDRTSSDELVNSGEHRFSKNEDSSPDLKEPMMQDDGRSSLKPNIEKYAKESADDRFEQTGDGRPSNELRSSAQFSHQDTESPSPGVSEYTELNTGKDMSEQYPSWDQSESEDYVANKPEGNIFLTVGPLTGEGAHQSKLSSCGGAHNEVDGSIYHLEDNNGEGQSKFSGQIESAEIIEFAVEASPAPLVACDNPLVACDKVMDVNEDKLNNFNTSNLESSFSSMKGDVLVAAQSPLNEGIVSENLSPYEKYIEQSQKSVLGFDRVGSDESLVSLPTIPRHALSAMSKSPTRIYYGGDASVSSYDGNDDQIANWPSHTYKGKFKATDLPDTHRSRKTDGFRARKMQDSKLEMHHDQIASPSIFAEKNINNINGREWNHDELPRHERKYGAIRRMRFDADDPISRSSFISRSTHLVHGNGSPSSYRQNVFQHQSRFNLPDTDSYTEPDKKELLRRVYELEDKLNKRRIPHWMENEKFSSEVRGYERHTHDIETEGNIYTDCGNSMYRDSFRQEVGWPPQSDISRKAFSDEAAFRHQVDCSCSYCYPHDWQRPRHLPSHSTSSSKFRCTAPPSHNHQKAFISFSSTPQLYASSQFSSWGQEINSDDQKYKENEQKRSYMRDKYHTAKRHIRPMASGAPIVTCCHCSELLQLPVDFLIYKKRCHQLRCNSCNQILKFSLKKLGHLVPYDPNASTPSIEMGDNGVPLNRTLPRASNYNHSSHTEPISFSDDCGPSFSRSYSTEQEHSVVSAASCSLQKNTHKKKMSSSATIRPFEGRIKNSISRNSQSMHQNSRETFELVGTSSKMSNWGKSSSEIREVPATSGSPLHQSVGDPILRSFGSMNENPGEAFESIGTSSRIAQWRMLCSEIEELPAPLHKLMGYSSPHQVMYASPGDESEEEVNSGRPVSGQYRVLLYKHA